MGKNGGKILPSSSGSGSGSDDLISEADVAALPPPRRSLFQTMFGLGEEEMEEESKKKKKTKSEKTAEAPPAELALPEPSQESLLEQKKADMLASALAQERQELAAKMAEMEEPDESSDEEDEQEEYDDEVKQMLMEGYVPKDSLMKEKNKLQASKQREAKFKGLVDHYQDVVQGVEQHVQEQTGQLAEKNQMIDLLEKKLLEMTEFSKKQNKQLENQTSALKTKPDVMDRAAEDQKRFELLQARDTALVAASAAESKVLHLEADNRELEHKMISLEERMKAVAEQVGGFSAIDFCPTELEEKGVYSP